MRFLFRPLYNMLTAGETISSLEATIQKLHSAQVYPIADYIREYAKTNDEVNKNVVSVTSTTSTTWDLKRSNAS